MPSIAGYLLAAAVWERVESVLTHPEIGADDVDRLRDDDSTTADRADVDRQQMNRTRAMSLTEYPDSLATLTAEPERVGTRRRSGEAALAAIPEDDLFDPTRVPWLNGRPLAAVIDGMANHFYEEHAPDIRAWLDGALAEGSTS